MRRLEESKLVNTAVEMRRTLTESYYGINDLMRLYVATPMFDYFKQDASLGGYVPHKRKLRKRNYFV